MPTSIITTDDLRDFKMELLDDIKKNSHQTIYRNLKKISEIIRGYGNAADKSGHLTEFKNKWHFAL